MVVSGHFLTFILTYVNQIVCTLQHTDTMAEQLHSGWLVAASADPL